MRHFLRLTHKGGSMENNLKSALTKCNCPQCEPKLIKCPECDGTGIEEIEQLCSTCKGAGCHYCKFDGSYTVEKECPKCEGLGEVERGI